MQKSESIKEITAALVAVQAALPCAKKDTANPFFKSKYADLSEIVSVSRELLQAHGLAVIQGGDVQHGMTGLSTLISHISGEWIESFYPLNPTKNDPQGMGSAVTYARRYMRGAMIGIVAEEDDDGNAASVRVEERKEVKKESLPAPAALQAEITKARTLGELEAIKEKYKRPLNLLKKDSPQDFSIVVGKFSERKGDILAGVAGQPEPISSVVLDDEIPF